MREPAIQSVAPAATIDWLRRGWQDLWRSPMLSIAHGVVLLFGAVLILAMGLSNAGLLAGAFSGFMLVAPGLLAGVYALSRAASCDEALDLSVGLRAWRRTGWRSVRFGMLLAAIGSLWVLFSTLILVAAGATTGGVRAYLAFFAGYSQPGLFAVWLVSGATLAALVFAISVVSMPMLIDRPVPVRKAIETSVAAVATNPLTLALWASLVMSLVLIGFVTIVGLMVVLPWVAHATWHAYRDLVPASDHAANT